MLQVKPSERITAEEALNHPFFSDLHDPNDEPVCEQPFFVEHEIDNLPLKILKRKILRNSCLNMFEKKSYHSSEENLFKEFDETFTSDMVSLSISKPAQIHLNSRGEENYSSDHHTNTSVESLASLSQDMCIPSLRDAMSREEIPDEPYRDPGVCERKYHETQNTKSHDLPAVTLGARSIILDPCQEDTSYFSGFSPVIDQSEQVFSMQPNTSQSFLETHGRCCAINNIKSDFTYPGSKDEKSLTCLNDEILKTLNARAPTNNCNIEDLMSNKLSKTTPKLVHWDSLRFWL